MMAASRIIVGVDGSEESARAVRWCADHATRLGDEVVAVHVMAGPVYVGDAELPVARPSADQVKALHDRVERDWCKPLADAGVAYRVTMTTGRPTTALINEAEREDAELVVAGRRGRGGAAEVLMGSTSRELTHHLGRPLVVVP